METRVIDSQNIHGWVDYFLNLGLNTKNIVDRLSKAGWRFQLADRPEAVYHIKNPKQFVYMLYNPEVSKPAVF